MKIEDVPGQEKNAKTKVSVDPRSRVFPAASLCVGEKEKLLESRGCRGLVAPGVCETLLLFTLLLYTMFTT